LAQRGFAGPESVLEGKFGFCRAFSDSPNMAYLTHRLGREFETLNICIKRYACHINAHAPIEGLQKLKEQHRFAPEDVAQIVIGGIEKLVTHHSIYEPKDLMMAQYSIPFCAALSLYDDPMNPESFNERKIREKKILAVARLVRLKVDREIEEQGWDRAARVTVRLKNGRTHTSLVVHFRGTPQNPLSPSELEDKAKRLTHRLLSPKRLQRLIETVHRLEKVNDLSALSALFRAVEHRS
jgi:2-methylcitrate dehydratase PrpD